MVLTIENNSEKIIAELKINDAIERYKCFLSVCENPVCTCGTVNLELTALNPADHTDESTEPQRTSIDVYEKTLGYAPEEEIAQAELTFATGFLNSLDERDFNLLKDKYHEFKNRISEQASPDSIDAQFDYEKVEADGLMSFYNDVLPYGDKLVVSIDGRDYKLQDQYCLLPKCPCTDAYLILMLDDSEAVSENEVCDIAVNYQRKSWKAGNEKSFFVGIDAIKSLVEAQIPDIYKLLLKRHEKMKSIYAHCRDREYQAEAKPRYPKVGRNNPCPCGSGKKYKKCCLKQLQGA